MNNLVKLDDGKKISVETLNLISRCKYIKSDIDMLKYNEFIHDTSMEV